MEELDTEEEAGFDTRLEAVDEAELVINGETTEEEAELDSIMEAEDKAEDEAELETAGEASDGLCGIV